MKYLKAYCYVLALFLSGTFLALFLAGTFGAHPTCRFDRNEPGPQGWWWEIYKCSDGTKRRELVASPRG